MFSKRFPVLLIFLLVIAIAILAYFLGKNNGSKTIENIATNESIVKEITELASLEVRGTATIKHTNVQNDGSLSDQIKKYFVEKSINVALPYIAKYGVNMENKKTIVHAEKSKKLTVTLPEPTLLSYELVMDKMQSTSKEGLLLTQNYEAFSKVQQSLYSKTRLEMESNKTHIRHAKEKIVNILKEYYAPTGYEVTVVFSGGEIFNITVDKK